MKRLSRGLALAGVAALVVVATLARAQDYPAKPIRLIVSFAAGSATDGLARVLGNELAQTLGQQFVIDNRGGANGILAAEAVARAAPDGYTLLITTHTTHAANPHLYKKLPYRPLEDFTPVARLTSSQFILVVHPSVPASNVQELVALAKAKPREFSYATTNSTSHVASAWLGSLAGIELTAVPYKSVGTAITDLVAGRIPMMFADQANAVPNIKAGKLRALAVSGESRTRLMPELATMREVGYPQFALNSWAAVFGPAGMPRPVVDKLYEALMRAVKEPRVVDRMHALGYEVVTGTPEELAQLNRAALSTWGTAIRAAKIEPE